MKCGTEYTCIKAFFLILVTAASGSTVAQSESTLTLELSGLAEAEGEVFIAVYNSPDSWLGDEAVVVAKVAIADARDGELVRTDLSLLPGDYAVSIFYDRNGNGKLDTNFIGIPKEPMALSNNAKAKFGPPKYSDAVFTLTENPTLQQLVVEK